MRLPMKPGPVAGHCRAHGRRIDLRRASARTATRPDNAETIKGEQCDKFAAQACTGGLAVPPSGSRDRNGRPVPVEHLYA